MDVTAQLATGVRPEELFSELEDLSAYPEWLEIVTRAVPTDKVAGDPGPAWLVDLRGQLGPLRRSKRLRMVRRVHNPPHRVHFTRRELDGRSHSPWSLTADVAPTDAGASLEMRLHYGGGLWVPLLDKLLGDEIERSKPRLLDRLDSAR